MERMRALIEGKNFAALRDVLAPSGRTPASAALLRLSRLFGGPEVLDEAEALAGETEAVEYLRALYGELSAAGYGALVRFDLGMVHQIDYYTGVVFRGYVEGQGMRCCLADATTRWWGYSAGRPRPPALP